MDARTVAKRIAAKVGLLPSLHRAHRLVSPSVRAFRRQRRAQFGQLIKPGDLVFDVGANLGQTIDVLRDLRTRVVAIEPNPACRPLLRALYSSDPDVVLVEAALGGTPGVAWLNAAGTDAVASLRDDWPGLAFGRGTLERVEVEVTTLDRLIDRHGAPKLCKVDVEGFETEVFAGLSQSIETVMFEYHLGELDRARQCLAKLATLGAQAVDLVPEDADDFLWGDWPTPEEASRRLGEPGVPRVGDLFVRTGPPPGT